MKLKQIIESGSNNILKWAIKNKADIKSDPQLQSIINNELFYIVKYSDVNFLELFRLTQIYRDRLRITNESTAEIPTTKELVNYFQGDISLDENNPEKKTPLCELASYAISSFYNIGLQMKTDEDIISRSSISLFLPMITRKFEVQIPVTFFDFVSGMTDKESKECFTELYPTTLDDIVDKEDLQGVFGLLIRLFLKSTSVIKYNNRLENYIKYTKYFPLKKIHNDKLYKIALIGFSKYNNVNRSEDKISLFQPDKTEYNKLIRKLNRNNSPLEVEFAVQMPIQYMQYIANVFKIDELMIDYPSSMSTIINDGFEFKDFIEPEILHTDEKYENTMNNFKNQITAYTTRIGEATNSLLTTINLLLNSEGDIDRTATFALLPPIYSTKAIFKFDTNIISSKLDSISDPIIHEIFSEMIDISTAVIKEIKESD